MQTETLRLRLRPFLPADLDALCRLYADPEVMRYLGKGVRTREETQAALTKLMATWSNLEFGMWALHHKETDEFVGRCGLQPLPDGSDVEVGYVLHRKFWGQGLTTEVAAFALQYGFGTVGLERIVAIARPQNIASWRVMEKLGMTYERTAPSPYDGCDVVWYGLSRERWQHSAKDRARVADR